MLLLVIVAVLSFRTNVPPALGRAMVILLVALPIKVVRVPEMPRSMYPVPEVVIAPPPLLVLMLPPAPVLPPLVLMLPAKFAPLSIKIAGMDGLPGG